VLRRLIAIVACVASVVAAAACGRSTAPGSPTESSSDIQGAWWSWAATEPVESNPVADDTGEFCDRNQPDDAWFLAGTFGGEARRHCAVPQGRPIIAPIINLYSGDPADCADFMRSADGSAKLDGAALPVERFAGDPIVVEGVAGNAVGAQPGRHEALGCGLWVRISSITPGEHTLRIRGSAGDFRVSVDYDLTVGGASA
jgi:hypothetical protein